MTGQIAPGQLKDMLHDGEEIALLDIRESGRFIHGHLLYAVNVPASRLELMLPRLAPNPDVRSVLIDDGDGLAIRTAGRMIDMGYAAPMVLEGGNPAWKAVGYELFEGQNVPSKAFGEVVEHGNHTPSIPAEELQRMVEAGEDLVILDSRTPAEYHRMSIPGGKSCPGAELVYRLHAHAPNPGTTVVVNCAGRTRSIIGAQSLINAGVGNRVVALRNGTMGWQLAGYELDYGRDPKLAELDAAALAAAEARAALVRERYNVGRIDRETLESWRTDRSRTTFLLDIRSLDDYLAGHVPGAHHAPGGQLVQATDEYVGVLGARIVLTDDTEVRAVMSGHWLSQMGWEVHVLAGGIGSGPVETGMPAIPPAAGVQAITTADLKSRQNDIILLDVSRDMAFRDDHIEGSVWWHRSRLSELTLADKPVCVVSEDGVLASYAARDLQHYGFEDVTVLDGGLCAWKSAGYPTVSDPAVPADEDCLDFWFWVHDRHYGNADAARYYLDWEIGLPAQIERDGDARYRLIV